MSDEIIDELRDFFIQEKFQLEKELQAPFQNFLDYLDKFFFNPTAVFNSGYFNYFDAIVMTGYCTTSTNCLKTINKQLKLVAGVGLLTLNNASRVLQNFE